MSNYRKSGVLAVVAATVIIGVQFSAATAFAQQAFTKPVGYRTETITGSSQPTTAELAAGNSGNYAAPGKK